MYLSELVDEKTTLKYNIFCEEKLEPCVNPGIDDPFTHIVHGPVSDVSDTYTETPFDAIHSIFEDTYSFVIFNTKSSTNSPVVNPEFKYKLLLIEL